ncbi:MAG: hypothetical protein AB7P99_21050 [Vicinamibacterales bacterium]
MRDWLVRWTDLGFREAPQETTVVPAAQATRQKAVNGIGLAVIGGSALTSWLERSFPALSSVGGGRAAALLGEGAVVILVFALVVIGLAQLVHWLSKRPTPLYWQVAGWVLMVAGILLRRLTVEGLSGITPASMGLSVVMGFVVMPLVMRRVTGRYPRPDLRHVAAPVSVGFFLDVAQVLTLGSVPMLPPG